MNFQSVGASDAQKKAVAVRPAQGTASADQPMSAKEQTMEIPVAGKKRTYVDATAGGQQLDQAMLEESKDVVASDGGKLIGTGSTIEDGQLRGLQDIIEGLRSQKRRRVQ